ncbi:MAG: DUF433 domain-containing protein [Methylobacterium sp.]|uniref:DUF433 domain-containing protein n=1 Tax=Methylobacterium sp. TaxID=409 RepID=UPI002587094F|nr:DUF433 domain-containing protein [Methylobacterium sp.]MBY0298304.1 DUF433 domain-containing protein [Methylobacterium sp.]
MGEFSRMTRDPAIMEGRACIRGMRVAVSMVLGNLGVGVSIGELLAAGLSLQREDVPESLRYAAWIAQDRELPLTPAAFGFGYSDSIEPIRY